MSSISDRDKRKFEELFKMSSGYVLDFSNRSFSRFVKSSINLDIYEDVGYTEYCSKAKKLRQIWEQESDYSVAVLMLELLDHFEDQCLKANKLSDYEEKKISELKKVCEKLLQNQNEIELPNIPDETFNTLNEDINSALSRNQPSLILDRLHTYSVKFLRKVSEANGLEVKDANGRYYPMQNLVGALKKQYEKESLFHSSFTSLVIRNSISLFEAYNNVRNTESYAHDNVVLGNIEARLVVKMIASLITFIKGIEDYRKKFDQPSSTEDDGLDDIPF
ncbi:MAG: abortive infection family protein [Bacilli bacterium]